MAGRYERKKPKKKGGKIALIVVAVILVVLAAIAGAGYWYYDSLLGQIKQAELIEKDPSQDLLNEIGPILPDTEPTEAPTETTVPETTVPETIPPMKPEDIINILVIGQSARPGEEARMADSTMLVTINKYTKTIYLHSVLRDAFVKYPQYKGGAGGRCKFASAYANAYAKWHTLGAMEVMNLLMKENFGVTVDYNFEVDFEMFTSFINSLGAIHIKLTDEEREYMDENLIDGYDCDPDYDTEDGYTIMDGYMALVYARMRKADGDNDSDIKRTARQRHLVEQVLAAVKYKFKTEGIAGIQEVVDATVPYLTTNMDKDEMKKLITDILPILADMDIEQGTLPVQGSSWGDMVDIYNIGRLDSVLRFDVGQNVQAMKPITEGIFPEE